MERDGRLQRDPTKRLRRWSPAAGVELVHRGTSFWRAISDRSGDNEMPNPSERAECGGSVRLEVRLTHVPQAKSTECTASLGLLSNR